MIDDRSESGEAVLETTLSGTGLESVVPAGNAEQPLVRGSAVGRYTVLERIGAGGMGVVYSAFDPQLDRRVALKIMHPGRVGLLREAQAMARLTHPNVITVHDVGTHDRQVFVAMEFVDGPTLRAWLRHGHHEWSETVHAFVRAGRGLAAAHAAGLVHRDFKPDNVLMGQDGRVLVMDFGLARVASRGRPAAPLTESSGDSSPSMGQGGEVLLTRTGAMHGTPAYMAPEQHRSAEVGPLADQFSFCVALYEGLYDERPFAGNSLTSIAMNVLEGRVRPAPRDARVPSWLRQVLLRGLRIDPSERFPSMDALLAELQREPPRKARPMVALGIAAAVASSVVAGYLFSRAPADGRCRDDHEPLAGTWNAEVQERLRGAFLRGPTPYAEATWRSVEAELDDYAGRWTATFTARCEAATHTRRSRADVGPDPGFACLDGRTRELEALLDVLADPRPAVHEHAVAATLRLPDPEPCLDARVEAQLPHTPELVAAVTVLEREIAETRARVHTGDDQAAVNAAAALVSSAAALESPALEAEALLLLAEARVGLVLEGSEPVLTPIERRRELRAAESSLRRALLAAAQGQRADLEARAWLRQIPIVGLELGRADEARRLALGAEAALHRLDRDDPALEAEHALALGAIDQADGLHEDALDHFRRALALRRAVFPATDLRVAEAQAAVGLALEGMSRFDEAIEAHNASLATVEAVLGERHPEVATALTQLSRAQLGAGHLEAAMASLVRARLLVDPRSDAELGEDPLHGSIEHTRRLAQILDALGLVHRASERFDAAAEHHTRAVTLLEARLGADAPELGDPIENLGLALTDAGRPREAVVHLERALALWQRTLAADHSALGVAHLNLANALWATGQAMPAREHYVQALAIWEESFSPEHPLLAYALTGIGRAELALGAAEAATEVLERAFALRHHESEDRLNLAETSLLLGRALWATGRDAQRALDHVVSARDIVGAYEPHDAAGLRRVLAGGDVPRFTDNLAPAGLGSALLRFLPE